MRKIGLWAIVVIGIALIAMPVATGMFSRASAGERVINSFKPIMKDASVTTTEGYFAQFKTLAADFAPAMAPERIARFQRYLDGMEPTIADSQAFIGELSTQLGMTPTELADLMGTSYPHLALMLATMPQMRLDMAGMVAVMTKDGPGFATMPTAMTHFQGLISTMRAEVADFAEVTRLPAMGLLPWFFMVPGILLVLIAGSILVFGMRAAAVPVATEPAIPRAA